MAAGRIGFALACYFVSTTVLLRLAAETLASSELMNALGLFMMRSYQRAREEVIIRQQTEIAELSTPVVKLWQGRL